MRPDALAHEEEIVSLAHAAPLDASLEQLEALTALASAASDEREVASLLEGLAETITRLTDYRTCMIALFKDVPPYDPRVVSYSSNIPPEYIERFASGSYPREDVRRLLEEGLRIEVGSLGFAAYFPPTHYRLLERVFPDPYKAGIVETAPSGACGASRWNEGDALFVPLASRVGEYFGVISLDDPRSNCAPDRHSVLPVVAFARQAAQLLERQRDADALAQQVEREALINRITRALRRSLDPEEVFHAAVEEMGVHLQAERCTLYMLDREAEVARKVAEYDAEGVAPAGGVYPFPLIRNLIEQIKTHSVLAFDDVENDPRIKVVYESILKDMGARSVMYAAVVVGDEPRGGFAVSTLNPRRWRESDVALARAVADQTGIAIRQAELYKRAEATSAREALINRLGHAIRASLNPSEILHAATHELGRALQASRVYLRLYDPARAGESRAEHEYLAEGVESIADTTINYLNPLGRRMMDTLRTLVVDDGASFSETDPEVAAQVRAISVRYDAPSMIFCPLVVQGRFRGGLCIHQTGRVRRWDSDEVALVEAVAAQLAVSIAQAELFEMITRGKQTWEATFDAMSDGVFIFDNQRRLARVNRAGAALESLEPRELLGKRCCDILRTDKNRECLIERVAKEGRSLTLEYVPEQLGRTLLVTAEPIRFSEREAGTVCTVRDLSELRHVEQLARERQSLLMNVLESARESICALNPEGKFMWCNKGATTMLDYPQEDLIGEHFMKVIDPSDAELAQERFRRVLKGEAQSVEVKIYTREGQQRHCVSDTTPLVIDGRTLGVLSITRDVTEQRQERERAAQADKLRALGQLASGVAHDFNNALAAIIGRAELLRRSAHNAEAARGLDVILTAAEDAAATVRRIRAFARQTPGEFSESVSVAELLRDAVEITRTRWENEARARGQSYDVSLEAAEDCTARANPSELREVFVNLVFNALDAMPEGGSLKITCAAEADILRVSFADTGLGMSDEVRERIFEPFYTTKGAQGTGLGLFVSYGIIERHGGAITVESEQGRGTLFQITLPRAEECDSTQAERASRQRTENALRVLVVDDEPFVREALADILRELGHAVREAASGREALSILERESFDAVFSDLSMPEIDGWELAREVKRRDPRTRVAIVTGYGKDTPLPESDASTADAIIGKPFAFDQIEETLSSFKEPR